jgi:hypothetical protein
VAGEKRQYKGRVKDECGGNIVYSWMKMEK